MRSCNCSMRLFGSVVIIVQERSASPSLGFHSSYRPANASGPRLPSAMLKGCLSFLRHSKNDDAGIIQRRALFHAPRNMGLDAMPSERALKVENFPISFDHDGTNPHRISDM